MQLFRPVTDAVSGRNLVARPAAQCGASGAHGGAAGDHQVRAHREKATDAFCHLS